MGRGGEHNRHIREGLNVRLCQQSGKILPRDQIKKLASVKSVTPKKNFLEQSEFLPKDLDFYHWDF